MKWARKPSTKQASEFLNLCIRKAFLHPFLKNAVAQDNLLSREIQTNYPSKPSTFRRSGNLLFELYLTTSKVNLLSPVGVDCIFTTGTHTEKLPLTSGFPPYAIASWPFLFWLFSPLQILSSSDGADEMGCKNPELWTVSEPGILHPANNSWVSKGLSRTPSVCGFR